MPAVIGFESMQSEDDMRKRAAARAAWPGKKVRLEQEEEGADLSSLTPGERIALVWRLTQDAWAFKGEPLPTYRRQETPCRLVRGHGRS
jgi:hypothetical protein